MILTGSQIIEEVKHGNIMIEPFSEKQVNPNSYNYRLGDYYIEMDDQIIYDARHGCEKYDLKKIPKNGLVLKEKKLYLCSTYEKIGSDEYVTSLIGKSSMGRLGIFLQASADLGHQGQIHNWTLEIRCAIPTKIYPGMVIGQVSFWKVEGDKYITDGYYTKFDCPQVSKGVK